MPERFFLLFISRRGPVEMKETAGNQKFLWEVGKGLAPHLFILEGQEENENGWFIRIKKGMKE